MKAAESSAKELFRQQWSSDAIKEARERLQYLLKNPPPLLPVGSCIAPFCSFFPPICKENMARRLAKRRCRNLGLAMHQASPQLLRLPGFIVETSIISSIMSPYLVLMLEELLKQATP